MKKTILRLLIAGIVVISLASPVVAGGKKDTKSSVLTVGATPVPHADLLNLVKDDLAAKGITLKVVEFSDYLLPNTTLISGDLDANFFQHLPYLQSNPEWNAALVTAFGVHVEPFGLYSNSIKSLADLKDGASIAIPNDPSNGGRALLLLAANGVITLKPGTGITATIQDIATNPKNLKFRELEAAQLPRSLPDVDAATINGNYALEVGLIPARDAIIIEGAQSPYVNYVVVKKGAENDPRIQALKTALLSQKVKDYINKTWSDGSVVAIF